MHAPPRANGNGIASAVLVVAPVLGALAAWAVPRVATLADHPAAWLGGIAAGAVAITTLALAADDGEARGVSPWALLLAWPLAFPLAMARRGQTAGGIVAALALCGAVAWSGWRIAQANDAADFLLQPSGEAFSEQASGEQKPGQASGERNGGMTDAELQRYNEDRINRILDAEQGK